ncbi:MAG TPA: hypothetical protein VFQ65_21505 [Kofleriaceae bacterium]|nr:hypothetical protein [Kofleriaceae bacterium]
MAYGQAQIVQTDAPKPADEKLVVKGWNPFLAFTGTFNLVSNSNVIGQVDGTSTVIGAGLLTGADYVDGKHFLQLSLSATEAFSRTPVIHHFIKSNDAVKLEGVYNYFLAAHEGLYGRLTVATSLFSSDDIRGTPTTWVDATGTTPVPLSMDATKQHLADGFQPLTISESVGGFIDPVSKEAFNLSLRLGIGGRSTFADGVFVNHDNAATPEVELLELSTVHQLGIEAFAGAVGKLEKGKFNYKAGFAVLLPFVNNDAANRSATSLTRVAFEATLTYTMASWFSVVYSSQIIRDPQLFPAGKDEIQVQNTLLATFQFNLVKKKEAPKPKTKEELELEGAIKRADDAEKALKDALKKLDEKSAPPSSPIDTSQPTPPQPPTSTPPVNQTP